MQAPALVEDHIFHAASGLPGEELLFRERCGGPRGYTVHRRLVLSAVISSGPHRPVVVDGDRKELGRIRSGNAMHHALAWHTEPIGMAEDHLRSPVGTAELDLQGL